MGVELISLSFSNHYLRLCSDSQRLTAQISSLDCPHQSLYWHLLPVTWHKGSIIVQYLPQTMQWSHRQNSQLLDQPSTFSTSLIIPSLLPLPWAPGFFSLSTADIWGQEILYYGGTVLCIVGYLATSLVPTRSARCKQCLPSHSHTTKNVSSCALS